MINYENFDFSSEDDAFISISQKKKLGDVFLHNIKLTIKMLIVGTVKPKDMACSQSKRIGSTINDTIVAMQPQPQPRPLVIPTVAVRTAPKLDPCLGCRQPFLRVKRPISLNGPKFPCEQEIILWAMQIRHFCSSKRR